MRVTLRAVRGFLCVTGGRDGPVGGVPTTRTESAHCLVGFVFWGLDLDGGVLDAVFAQNVLGGI